MDSWLAILQGASFVGLLIVTTVAGLQRGQVQNLKATIEGLRGDRDDLSDRLDRRDSELGEERSRRADERHMDQAKIAELTSAVNVLRETVTGETHLVALEGAVGDMAAALARHHGDAMGGVQRLEDALVRVEQAVSSIGGKP
jgi:chromosome segregation ATPase